MPVMPTFADDEDYDEPEEEPETEEKPEPRPGVTRRKAVRALRALRRRTGNR